MGRVVGWEDLGGDGPTHFRFRGGEHGASFCVLVGDHPPGGGPRPHRHPYEEVFVVHEGRATFTAGGETLEAGGGQVVVPAGTPHKFVNACGGRLRVTSLHPRPHSVVEWLED